MFNPVQGSKLIQRIPTTLKRFDVLELDTVVSESDMAVSKFDTAVSELETAILGAKTDEYENSENPYDFQNARVIQPL